jgi:hypothetical protein
VPEMKTAVDAQQRKSARDFGAPENSEREAARLNGDLLECRRFPLLLPKREKSLAC